METYYKGKTATGVGQPTDEDYTTWMNNNIYRGASANISATDILAYCYMPIAPDADGATTPFVLGSIHTISMSTYMDRFEVRTLGRVYPAGMTAGPRTIGGTLIFSSLNKWEFQQALTNLYKKIGNDGMPVQLSMNTNIFTEQETVTFPNFMYADELPPFDIYIIAATEYGVTAYMRIEGVRIMGMSTSISIRQLDVDNVYTYKAVGISNWIQGEPSSAVAVKVPKKKNKGK